MFNIGDICCGSSRYFVTNEDSTLKVLEKAPSDTLDTQSCCADDFVNADILVELVDSSFYKNNIGKTYWIDSSSLTLIKPNKRNNLVWK